MIKSGIDIANYEKALEIIKEQIEDMKSGKFTENDLEIVKKILIDETETVCDEQVSQIVFCYEGEFKIINTTVEELIEKIKKVTKEDVIEIANKVKINTIYFLRN